MTTASLLSYYRDQISAFNENMLCARSIPDPECIHDLRVSVKRLRALFKFVEYTDDRIFNSGKEFKIYRKTFKQCSLLRDAQVQLELYETLELRLENYRDYLEHMVDESHLTFKEWIKDQLFEADSIVEREIGLVCSNHGKELETKLAAYIRSKLEEVRILNNSLRDGGNFHVLRIRLKELHYLFDIANLFKLGQFSNDLLWEMKQIENHLGDWHDLHVGLDFIKKFQEQSMAKEAGSFDVAMDKMLKKAEEHYRYFTTHTRAFLEGNIILL